MIKKIIHIDIEDGETNWTTDGMDGLAALGVMCSVLYDMRGYYITDPLRPFFVTPASRVCIEFDGDNVAVSYRPEGPAAPALGLMFAALAGLSEKAAKGEVDPMQALLGAILIEAEPVEAEV
jgi:hypothetical protein|tara:strand:+ start:2084 stop:2449 length:366 start_codon:yes stop_codon:yes gene_type:complete